MTKLLKTYSDGGARGNPGPAAIGVLVCSEDGAPLREFAETIGEATNNVAEYKAAFKALSFAGELGAEKVECYLDSELVCKQLSGHYRLKAEHLKPLYLAIREKEKEFQKVSYTHVPRTHENIEYVDGLLNQCLNRSGR